MFRPVVAIIRSWSFDTLKSTLYNCVVACLIRRSQHQGLFEFDISILGVWVRHSINLTDSHMISKSRGSQGAKTKKPKLIVLDKIYRDISKDTPKFCDCFKNIYLFIPRYVAKALMMLHGALVEKYCC